MNHTDSSRVASLDPLDPLDQEFVWLYQPDDGAELLTGTAAEVLAANKLIVTVLCLCRLPALTDALRKSFVGSLTPSARELLIVLIQVLTDEPDIARESGVSAAKAQDLLDRDVEVQRLGDELGGLASLTDAAANVQDSAAWLMIGEALLAAQQFMDSTDPSISDDQKDRVRSVFAQAMKEYADLLAAPAPTQAPAAAAAPPRTLSALQKHVADAAQVAGARSAVATIQATAAKMKAAGLSPAPSEPVAAKGRKKTLPRASQ